MTRRVALQVFFGIGVAALVLGLAGMVRSSGDTSDIDRKAAAWQAEDARMWAEIHALDRQGRLGDTGEKPSERD